MMTQTQLTQKRGHIAIIALQPNPSAPADLHPSTHLQGWIHNLTQLGWQVDVFRQRPAIAPPEHETLGNGWRTVYLDAALDTAPVCEAILPELLPSFLKAFLHYQSKTGILYPLIHTHSWLSGWMGLALKEKQLIKLIHTPDSLSNAHPESTPLVTRMRSVTEQTCHAQADQVVYLGKQDHPPHKHLSFPKGAIAHSAQDLDQIYLTALYQLYQEFFAVG